MTSIAKLKKRFSDTYSSTAFGKSIDKELYGVVTLQIVLLGLYYSFLLSLPIESEGWLKYAHPYYYFEIRHHVLGLLLNIPVLYVLLSSKWEKGILIWLGTIVLIVPYMVFLSFNINSFLFNVAFLFIPGMLLFIIRLELKWREKEREAIHRREEERKEYMRHLLKAQETDRKRIAQELHDEVIQTIMVITSRVHRIVKVPDVQRMTGITKELQWVHGTSLSVAQDLRRICQNLRPVLLDDVGFIPAIRWLTDRFYQESSVVVKFYSVGCWEGLSPDIEAGMFRIVQEALRNVMRHGNATEVRMNFHSSDWNYNIVIVDNGKGFNMPETFSPLMSSGKLGVLGMFERANLIGAKLTINSAPGKGTRITIDLPKETVGHIAK